jgi:hypothetical protein
MEILMKNLIGFALLLALTHRAPAAEPLPKTQMTTIGEYVYWEDFAKDLPSFTGKPKGFASGFSGWRYNVGPRGGHWNVTDETLHGSENADANHPATASYGFDFQNAIISFDCRMDDVPLNGRKYRYLQIRTTDENDYICGVHLNPGGMSIVKEDHDHAGPDKLETLGSRKFPFKVGEWYHVVVEILDDEITATVNGQTLTGKHPLIASPKHSIMFVIGNEGSVRSLRIFGANANPDWPANRARLLEEMRARAAAEKK